MIKYIFLALIFPFLLVGQNKKHNINSDSNSIVISEIMYDPTPSVYLPEAEYLELFNNSDQDIIMSGWNLFVGKKMYNIPNYTLKTGEYVLLTKDVTLFTDVNVLQVNITSLSNSGTTLRIENSSEDIINSIYYNSKMFSESAKKDGGWSLELINPKNDCIKKENWDGSKNINGGTPGLANSITNLQYFPDVSTDVIKVVTNDDVSSLAITFSHFIAESSLLLKTDYPNTYNLSSNNSADGSSEVVIDLSSSIGGDINYFVFDGLKSCDGNIVKNDTIWLSQFQNILVGDIKVNEVMFNPKEGSSDFVELYNVSDKFLSLRSASIGNFIIEGTSMSSDNVKKITTDNIIFAPKSYLVITTDAQSTIETYHSGNRQKYVEISSMPSLNNTQGNIAVFNPSLEFVDAMVYNDEMFSESTKKDGDWSLELINPDNNCIEIGNWDGSSDALGATPGLENSINNTVYFPSMENMITKVVTNDDESTFNIFYKQYVDESSISISSDYLSSFSHELNTLPDGTSVISIILDKSIGDDINYFLLKGLNNCDGSEIETDTVWVSKTVDIQEGDLRVNEVMFKPLSGNSQYIEVLNVTDKFFNLKDVVLVNYIEEEDVITTDNEKIITDENLILEPHSYFIFTTNVDNVLASFNYNKGRNFIETTTLPKMNTTNGNVAIINSDSDFIDLMYYTSDMFDTDKDKDGGVSLELINPDNKCVKNQNWSSSIGVEDGTPGRLNSIFDNGFYPEQVNELLSVYTNDDVSSFNISLSSYVDETSVDIETSYTDNVNYYVRNRPNGSSNISIDLEGSLSNTEYFLFKDLKSCDGGTIVMDTVWLSPFEEVQHGDIVINEIMFYPKTDNSEFIELYNNTDKFLSLKGTYLSNFTSEEDSGTAENEKLITDKNLVFNPRTYLVITNSTESIIESYKSADRSRFIEIKELPKLDNSEDNISILSSDFSFIDKVSYFSDMHVSLITSDKQRGVSLERIKASNPSLDVSNWTSASQESGGATPGFQNSVSPLDVKIEDNIEVYPELFTPNGDGFNDVVELKYKNDVVGSVANVKVFNSQGVFIKEIANNYLLGAESSFIWDGINEDNSICEKGIYIFWVEIFDTEGNVTTYKKVCVIG